jgi:hypothetical protein
MICKAPLSRWERWRSPVHWPRPGPGPTRALPPALPRRPLMDAKNVLANYLRRLSDGLLNR